MASKVPRQDPRPSLGVGAKVRNFLGWAFVISLAIHFLILPLVIRYNPSHAEEKEAEKVSLSKKVKVIVPTPPPPTPPPTPPPKQTPPPVKQTNPPPQPKLKVNVVKTTSKSSSGATEKQYTVKQGTESGVPQGVATSGNGKAVAAATPEPTPTPTPRPQCAVPNKDATTIQTVEADTPEMAKEQGITGIVEVEVDLDATGHVTGTSVIKTPSAILNSEALKVARQSTYSPKLEDCKPVAGQYRFVVDFSGQ